MVLDFINQKRTKFMSKQNTMTLCALTTKDNPFDPFDDYDKWFAFDISHGYNSSSYLARIADTSRFLTPEQNAKEVERAIDEILELNPLQVYKKVTKVINV